MKVRNEFKAGALLVTALVLFALSIWTIGREKEIFASLVEFHTSFKDVKGLAEGAPIRLGGITIGRVDRIGFEENLKDSRVHVTLLVNQIYLDRIRRDSVVTIETQGLLGDRFLNISLGQEEHALVPGAIMKSNESGDMGQILEKAGTVVDRTVEISESINKFLKSLNEETLKPITETAKNLSALTTEIKDGEGLMHRLVYSKTDADDILASLARASRDISSITRKVRTGDGLLNALIFEPEGKKTVRALTSAADNLSSVAEHVSQVAKEIRTGDGLAHDLVYGNSSEGLDEVVKKLNETASNLESASAALAKGSGTIGALLVDSKLYDNLVEVTDGAKRSYILRQAIRSSLEKDQSSVEEGSAKLTEPLQPDLPKGQ